MKTFTIKYTDIRGDLSKQIYSGQNDLRTNVFFLLSLGRKVKISKFERP